MKLNTEVKSQEEVNTKLNTEGEVLIKWKVFFEAQVNIKNEHGEEVKSQEERKIWKRAQKREVKSKQERMKNMMPPPIRSALKRCTSRSRGIQNT